MPILVSVAAVQHGTVQISGEVPAEDMAWDLGDPCVAARQPLRYEITAELMEKEILVQGEIEVQLDCECVRCLAPFVYALRIAPWSGLMALEGEDAAPRIDQAVDLTPQIREDILLALPQHPVCRPECRGLASQGPDSTGPKGPSDELRRVPSAWGVLDTLKLD